MFELLLIALYVVPVICAANLAARSQRISPLLAILTFGFVNISRLWRMTALAVQGMSFAETPAYDPAKPVHRAAAFLALLGVLLIASNHLMGDLPGDSQLAAVPLAEAALELVATGALHLAAAVLGVGWLSRRRLSAVVQRLSLRMPNLRETGFSVAVGAALWLLTVAALAVWEQTVPADVFEQQTDAARQFSEAFSASIFSAQLLALVPALSEEVFYRGALQPVFGVLLSSLFFTATHMQYGLTPAVLILLAVSLGFAWLRARYHTSAAIIAHAVFNFLPYLART